MFFLLAVGSMLAYSLQATLISKYARQMDGLSCAMYRNLTLAISMLPLLFMAEKSNFYLLDDFFLEFLLAGLSGGIALSASLYAVNFLPVGVATTLPSSIRVVILLLWGFFFFEETISLPGLLCVALILLTSFFLSTQDYKMSHLKKNVGLGASLVLTSGILGSVWFISARHLSRAIDPFLASYFLELAVGVGCFLVGIGRFIFTKQKFASISQKTFLNILWTASPTLIGTAFFTYASTLGSIGILGAIGAGGMIMTAFFSYFLFGEKLKVKHWLGIFLIVVSIAGLKVFS